MSRKAQMCTKCPILLASNHHNRETTHCGGPREMEDELARYAAIAHPITPIILARTPIFIASGVYYLCRRWQAVRCTTALLYLA